MFWLDAVDTSPDLGGQNVRCAQARKTMEEDGQHQDVDRTPRGRVNQNDIMEKR